MSTLKAQVVVPVVLMTSLSARVDACVDYDTVNPGPLGTPQVREEPEPIALPANAAFLVPTDGALPDPLPLAWNPETEDVIHGTHVLAVASGRLGIYRVDAPIPPGSEYDLFSEYGRERFEVSDLIDTEPPSPPELVEGDLFYPGGSCDDHGWLGFRMRPGTDDHTPEAQLTYAVYLGYSTAEALEVQSPIELESLYFNARWADDRSAYVQVYPDPMLRRDMFVAVAAIDMSGNESERSEPFPIEWHPPPESSSPSKGCQHVQGPVGGTSPLCVLTAVGVLARLRRRASGPLLAHTGPKLVSLAPL